MLTQTKKCYYAQNHNGIMITLKYSEGLPRYHHHHHHHISFTQLGHLMTRSSLTYPEISSKVYHDSFCQLGSSISLTWVIYFEEFYLHVVSFRETCQWLKFFLNGLWTQSRVSPVVGLLPLASGPACLGMALPP